MPPCLLHYYSSSKSAYIEFVHCSELFHPLGEEEAELVNGSAHPAMFNALVYF